MAAKSDLVDVNGNPVGQAAHEQPSYLEQALLEDAVPASPGESAASSDAPPTLDVNSAESFLLFRENGEYVLHLGPDNHADLNLGGFLVSYCVWAMNRREWVEEFQGFLKKLSEDPQVMDIAVAKASNEAEAEAEASDDAKS